MAAGRRIYEGTHVDVSFDAARCRHAAQCARGLSAVFDTSRRPWIAPDGADPAAVVEVVARCPTGALRAHPHEVAPEPAVSPATLQALPGGPLLIRGDLDVGGERETRAALCSCGATANQPYCDGSGSCSGWPASR